MPTQLYLPGLSRPAKPAVPAPSDELMAYPDVSSETLCRHAKAIGTAGEDFAVSMMTRFGLSVSRLSESDQADCLVRDGGRYLRCQVKTSTQPRGGVYNFTMAKGYHNAPQGRREYQDGDFEIAALVILPLHVVRFTAEWRNSHRIAVGEIPALRANPAASLRQALAAFAPEPIS